jgi:lysophospholipase L1-like esterase
MLKSGSTPEMAFDLPERASSLFPEVPWTRYVAMGDSSTEGIGDSVPGYPDGGWAQMVADALRVVRPELEFFNLGERFLTAKAVRETQLPRALELESDLVVLMAGGNDMMVEHFDADATGAELDAILSALLDAGATVFTCTQFDVFASGVMPEQVVEFAKPRFDQLNLAIRSLAEKYADSDRFVFDDAATNPAGQDPTIYSKDLLHANARGHALAATVVLESLAAHVASGTVERPGTAAPES